LQRLSRAGRELGGGDELHVERPHRRGALVVAKITHQGGAKLIGQADGAADGSPGRIGNRAWLKGDQNLAVSRGSTLYWGVLKSPDRGQVKGRLLGF
jgi:hypothetical protein